MIRLLDFISGCAVFFASVAMTRLLEFLAFTAGVAVCLLAIVMFGG